MLCLNPLSRLYSLCQCLKLYSRMWLCTSFHTHSIAAVCSSRWTLSWTVPQDFYHSWAIERGFIVLSFVPPPPPPPLAQYQWSLPGLLFLNNSSCWLGSLFQEAVAIFGWRLLAWKPGLLSSQRGCCNMSVTLPKQWDLCRKWCRIPNTF